MTNPYDVYLKTDISTASPVKQIVMLYDKAIVCLKSAIEDIKNKDYRSKVNNINRATQIILALNSSLDMEQGGEIAKNLRELYEFLYNKIVEAHAKNDAKLIEDVIDILETLREGWEGIS
jgi:flagellar protein FliS